MLYKLYSEDIQSFNLANTFYDLFLHIYMSQISHMKHKLSKYIFVALCFMLLKFCPKTFATKR